MKKQNDTSLSKAVLDKILKDRRLRIESTRRSHLMFFATYLHEHLTYPMADFQREMFRITEDQAIETAVITAFRGSAKSTIMTLSLPLWAILGDQKKKFILILSQTQDLAKQHFSNLKEELEHNEVLKKDLGPFREDDEWTANSIVIPKYDARITVASVEKSIRGIKSSSHRPELIICDDLEDVNTVRSPEMRDKTYNWLKRDVIPAGDRNTKLIIVGNVLHEDSLMSRLKAEIEMGKLNAIYRQFPIIDQNNNILWPGKFPDMKAIEREKKKIGNDIAWQAEFMLETINQDDIVVQKDWIKYYDEIPQLSKGQDMEYGVGLDMAISLEDAADFTAIVPAKIIREYKKATIYIMPGIINQKMTSPETEECLDRTVAGMGGKYNTRIYVENAALEKMLSQNMSQKDFTFESIGSSLDKRARLSLSANHIKDAMVLFPRKGVEKLIQQIVYCNGKHDDIADAFTALVLGVIQRENKQPRIRVFSHKPKGW